MGNKDLNLLLKFYDKPQDLPEDKHTLDELVRYSTGGLKNELLHKNARKVLKDVSPKISVGYLVGALQEENIQNYISEILLHYGPSDETVSTLVAGLQNNQKRDIIQKILLRYDSCDYTVRYLTGALFNPLIKDCAKSMLLTYGPNNLTCKYLVTSLREEQNNAIISEIFHAYSASAVTVKSLLYGLHSDNTNRHEMCEKILVSYGRAATPYLLKHNFFNNEQRSRLLYETRTHQGSSVPAVF